MVYYVQHRGMEKVNTRSPLSQKVSKLLDPGVYTILKKVQQLIVLKSNAMFCSEYLSALTGVKAQIPLLGPSSTPVAPVCSRQQSLSPSRHIQPHPHSAQPVPSLKRL